MPFGHALGLALGPVSPATDTPADALLLLQGGALLLLQGGELLVL